MISTMNDCYRHLEERIDEFEREMLQMIKNVANDSRNNLYRLMHEQMNDTRQHHDEIIDELHLKCNEDDYYESDFNRLRNNIEQIKLELNEISNSQNSTGGLYVHPVNWTNVFGVGVEDHQSQNEDAYGVIATAIIELERINLPSDNNLKLKLTQHKPKTAIDIESGPHSRLATSDHYLLHCTLDKLYAFDVDDIDHQRHISWDKDDWIIDICYSTLLKLFFIWSNSGFYTFDSSTMKIHQTIKNIPDTGTGWYRCTCFDDFLFLSYDGDVQQRKIRRDEDEYVLVNEWKSTVKNDNEVIVCMKMNELRIVLGIGEYGRGERVELCDYQMNILHTLYLNVCNVALLLDAKWLIITKSSNKLIMVNNDGEIEETTQYNCKDSVLEATIFGSNMLVIEIHKQLRFHDV